MPGALSLHALEAQARRVAKRRMADTAVANRVGSCVPFQETRFLRMSVLECLSVADLENERGAIWADA